MADVLFIAILIGFFLLSVALVRACEHIIGPEEADVRDLEPAEPETRAAA